MDNLEEMDKFLEMHNFPRLNQEEIDNMNRPITGNELESVIRKKQKRPNIVWLHLDKTPSKGKFIQIESRFAVAWNYEWKRN